MSGRTKAFSTKGPAERHANAMETDRERGDYIDPEHLPLTCSFVTRRFSPMIGVAASHGAVTEQREPTDLTLAGIGAPTDDNLDGTHAQVRGHWRLLTASDEHWRIRSP